MNKKILYSIIGLVLVGGLFSAVYAGPIINTITFAGLAIFKENAQFDKDVNIDGTLTATNLAAGPHTVDTNAETICATGEILDGDGACIPIPVDTNAETICATGEILDGDGACIPIPVDGTDIIFYKVGPFEWSGLFIDIFCDAEDVAISGETFGGALDSIFQSGPNAQDIGPNTFSVDKTDSSVSLITWAMCADFPPHRSPLPTLAESIQPLRERVE